jgi:GGDEF domain-containing protein
VAIGRYDLGRKGQRIMHMAILHRIGGVAVALWQAAERAVKKGFRHNTNHATPRLEKAGRAAFVDAIERALSGNKRLRQAAAAIVFELDDFRKIEELHDRDAGETLLDANHDRVSELLIEGDEILRLDGPRFWHRATAPAAARP